MKQQRIVAQLASPLGADRVTIEPGPVFPVVDASGNVIGYASVDADGLMTADVDDSAVAVLCPTQPQPWISIGGSVKR